MKTKNIIIGTVLTLGGYCVGTLVGYIKSAKFALDVLEEIVPGTKKHVAHTVVDKVINDAFDD